ncbi:MAG: NAD(P)H-dependent oxidoreductase [Clostridiales Family XIII bacterium]|jgi:chromate reductase|nr:NAD(P)H-dependent oxidoreductase [Clostridiales Family XIII bacterium]
MTKYHIAVLAGSLRRDAFTVRIAKYVSKLMPDDFEMKRIDLSGLVMFNQDFDDDGTTPEAWKTFREEIGAADGFLFVTPEYNRSFPAVLKNALDIGSRPYGQNLWDGKPGGLIGVTPGNMFAIMGANQLRHTMNFLNIILMNQPEQYIADVSQLLDADGNVTQEHKQKSLREWADAFAGWVRGVADKG